MWMMFLGTRDTFLPFLRSWGDFVTFSICICSYLGDFSRAALPLYIQLPQRGFHFVTTETKSVLFLQNLQFSNQTQQWEVSLIRSTMELIYWTMLSQPNSVCVTSSSRQADGSTGRAPQPDNPPPSWQPAQVKGSRLRLPSSDWPHYIPNSQI